MEEKHLSITDRPDSGDEELLRIYEHQSKRRADDSAAMQAALCIILAAVIFFGGMAYPKASEKLLHRIKVLSEDPEEFFPNPIYYIEKLL